MQGEIATGKSCTKCKLFKPLGGFYLCDKRYGRLNRRPWCRTCYSVYAAERRLKPGIRDKLNLQGTEWKKRNPLKIRDQFLRKYGLTAEYYDNALEHQGWSCALCSRPFDDTVSGRPEVDHDHATGFVRQIIHGSCNRVIGIAKDDIEILQRAIDYLQRHGK